MLFFQQSKKIAVLLLANLAIMLFATCKSKNHIEKYDVDVKKLLSLQDGAYAHRRGKIYFNNSDFMIWYTLDNAGKVKNVFMIQDLANLNENDTTTRIKYRIDTILHKKLMNHFLSLSKQYKFGHIQIDKKNKVSFSYRDGLPEQYVKTFNDSTKNKYLINTDFTLLENEWFEYNVIQ